MAETKIKEEVIALIDRARKRIKKGRFLTEKEAKARLKVQENPYFLP